MDKFILTIQFINLVKTYTVNHTWNKNLVTCNEVRSILTVEKHCATNTTLDDK